MRDKFVEIFLNKKIAILGFGKEGQSSFNFLKTFIPLNQIIIADKRNEVRDQIDPEELSEISLSLGEKYLERIENADIILKSPGIPKKMLAQYFPSDKITSQTDLFLRHYAKQIVGVTGTKGKSTTSSLIQSVFEMAGKDSILLGNIGKPPFDSIQNITDKTHIVYELSSHQLDDVHCSPHIAVILNLFEEHLDHFGSFENYKNAKYNISKFLQTNDWLVFNGDDPILKQKYKDVRPENKLVYSNQVQNSNGAFISGLGKVNVKLVNFFQSYDFSRRISLPGEHNLMNIMAALLAVKVAGVEDKAVLKAVNSFKGLEHRLEYVGMFKDIHFYNDSIATIPEATIEAIKTLDEVDTLILGGKDRGIDYGILIDFLPGSGVHNIIFLGEAGKRIYNGLKFNKKFIGNLFLIKNFNEIRGLVLKNTPSGTICLLSPAASSYDMFSNFEERGTAFKILAGNL